MRRTWMVAALAMIAMLGLGPAVAQDRSLQLSAGGERRVALVIGNADYPSSPLDNPVKDARAISAALKELNFDVLTVENGGKTAIERAIGDFGEKLGEGAVGLLFYAGHGMQVNGHNYLIPVDAKLASEQRVKLETVDVDVVLDQMAAAKTRVSLVILDACRNNPFERRFRSLSGGLAQMNAPEGTLIAYATAPGKVASDGSGDHGLYTAELLKALTEPGRSVEDVFKQVRVGVSRASNGAQTPWESSSLTGQFYFKFSLEKTTAGKPPVNEKPPAPEKPAAASADMATIAYQSIIASADPTEFDTFAKTYPDSPLAVTAKQRAKTLRAAQQQQQAAAAPVPTTTTANEGKSRLNGRPVPSKSIKAVDGSMEITSDTSFIAVSNAGESSYSVGKYEIGAAISTPLFMATRFERMTNDHNYPVELFFLGGAFGVARGSFYFYESEDHWTGWLPFPSSVKPNAGAIAIYQDGQTLTGYIDGKEVGDFTLNATPSAGKVSLFFKGAPKTASRVAFRETYALKGSLSERQAAALAVSMSAAK